MDYRKKKEIMHLKRWIKISLLFGIVITLISSPFIVMFVFVGCDPCDFGIKITKDRHFKKYAVSGDGSLGDPFILDSLNIITDTPSGIIIWFTSAHFIIQNSFIQSEELGIDISSISSGTGKIINNTFVGCGLQIRSSSYILIESNIFAENTYGIILANSASNTINNNVLDAGGINLDNPQQFISNNTVGGKDIEFFTDETNQIISKDLGQLIISRCSNLTFSSLNIRGVGVGITIFDSLNCSIINSWFKNCNTGLIAEESNNLVVKNITFYDFPPRNSYIPDNGYGIAIESSDYLSIQNCTIDGARYCAISISESDYCLLEFNRITNSRFSALDLYLVNFCEIIFNEFFNNTEWPAIVLSERSHYEQYSENNEIHHNNFINNAINFSSQVTDNCHSNFWYDNVTLEGNYWSDLGFATYYTINADEGVYDSYPFLTPINIFG